MLPGAAREAATAGINRLPERYRRFKVAGRSILERDEARRFIGWFGGFGDDDKLGLLSPALAQQIAAPHTSRIFHRRLRDCRGDSLTRMLYLDAAIWLPDNLLMKGDKMSMAASTELRMPLLDNDLLKLAVSIPANRRIRPFVSKYLLKEAYTGILPGKFLFRRKVGFQVPIGLWLRSDNMDSLRDLIVGDRALARGYFQPDFVRNLMNEHISGKDNHQAKLFVLLAVELWCRVHLDAGYSTAPNWDTLISP
jgi:asparagine synthase (glutamine-hydrolysing)